VHGAHGRWNQSGFSFSWTPSRLGADPTTAKLNGEWFAVWLAEATVTLECARCGQRKHDHFMWSR
jgi:hypothetical protein